MKHPSIAAKAFVFASVYAALFGSPALAEHGRHGFDEQMKPVVTEYLTIQKALAADSLEGVSVAARTLAAAAAQIDVDRLEPDQLKHYATLPDKLVATSNELAKAQTIEEARAAFKLLSRPMATWATRSMPAGVDVVFCSMADGSWLQTKGDIKNPYYGNSMLGCGEIVTSKEAKK